MTTRRQILNERARATEALLMRQAEGSLRAFVEQVWHILEPETPFLSNWHIDLICEYLEAVTAGQITRLVINLPPRYMKSLLVSVLWPVWEWLRAPQTRWLFASYSDSLSTKHSLDRRLVLQSPWYRDRWGDRFQLTSDQNEKTEYRNDRRGVMTATSVGGSATGKGGNRIVVDDPHNPVQAESDRQRQQALDFFLMTLSTRLDDKRKGAIVVIMQRLHTRDLTSVCLDQGYTPLIIPAEAEYPTTVTFLRSDRSITRAVGDLLWPERENAEDLARQKTALGAYAYAGQYQQRPSPRGGGLFKRDWWKYYDELPPDMQEHAQSWDLAFKGGGEHDFVVGLVAARRGADVYLIDRFKQRHRSRRRSPRCAARSSATRTPPGSSWKTRRTDPPSSTRSNTKSAASSRSRRKAGSMRAHPRASRRSKRAMCTSRTRRRRTGVRSPSVRGSTISSSRWPCSRRATTTMTSMRFLS